MPSVLHINSSPRNESSSLLLANEFLAAYSGRDDSVIVDTLDLFDVELPDFGAAAADAKMAAFSGQTPSPEGEIAWARARQEFDRFNKADELVFNVPMWNSGVPYILKQWIDVVTQPGWAFGFDPDSGYIGLLRGKRAVVVYTSGVYREGMDASFGTDFHSTFFDDWLRFVGITDIDNIWHRGNALSHDPNGDLDRALESARKLGESYR